MTIDRAALFHLAWARTRNDDDARWVYDWTPGKTYGHRRATTAAERRAIFAEHLRAAWADYKLTTARSSVPSIFSTVPTAELQAEVLTLENCDARLGWLRQERLSALCRELAQRAA
jgi:hypothetical protein